VTASDHATEDYFYDNDYYYTDDEYSPDTVLVDDRDNMDGVLDWYMRGREHRLPEEPLGPLGVPLDPDFDF
jgi:hypothetical protein